MPSVSHSETDGYLLCRRKHYYGYGLSLKRVTESSSLAQGSAGHRILEAFYKTILAAGDDKKLQLAAFDTGVSAAQAEYEALIKEGWRQDPLKADLYDSIFKFYLPNEPFVKEGWRVLATEKKFNLEYDSEKKLQYPFVVDLIALDPDGKTVVIDHKFVGAFYTYEQSNLQPQIPKYIGALRALNYKIDYGAYNMIRTLRIVGKKDKNHPAGAGPTLEQAMMYLPLKPNTIRVQRTFIEQIGVANEIQELKQLPIEEQEKRAFRVANSMVCKSCSFKDICTSELQGGNTALMLKTEYTVRERAAFDVSVERSSDPDE